MKKKFFLSCVVCILMFASCSDSDILPSVTLQKCVETSFFIPKDSAVVLANQAISAIAEKKETRGFQEKRTVASVDVVDLNPSMKTRTSDENAISSSLYIVNFQNNKGFAVLSSDKRLRPLYAVSDSGSIAIADTLKNENLALFFDGVKDDIVQASAKSPKILETSDRKIVISPQVYPMIWVAPSLWGQSEPYNTYCYTVNGEKAKVGCAAVACGIIMSYYGWPSYINDTRLNWHGMKKYTVNHDIDFVFGKLGEKQQLDMQYGVKSSGASTVNLSRTFVRMGYYAPDNLQTFSESKVCSLLDDTKRDGYGPLLVVGQEVNNIGGHGWVIDGYCKNVTNSDGSKVLYKTVLFHCVWGWNGANNGYFYLNNGKLGGSGYLFGQDDNGDTSTSYNFKKLRYMANFKIDNNKQKVNL